jgi:predicted DNA-binding transcriptional regulator AlpA
MSDENDSIFYTKKDVCRVTRLSPAQIDRLERAGKFPMRFNLTGAPNGKVVWLKCEVNDWCQARSRRKLKPPTDDSLDDGAPGYRPPLR